MFQNTPLSDLSAFMSLYFGSPLADEFRIIADFSGFLLWKRRRNRVGTPHFFFRAFILQKTTCTSISNVQ